MPNDVEEQSERIKVTPKPVPICTLFEDGSLKVVGRGIGLLELQRLLLSASGSIAERTLQRAAAMEQVLTMVQQRFDGFDPATEKAMAAVLGHTATLAED
jgi:hypothetical protein